MKPKFSKGVFLNIVSPDRKKWQEGVKFIKSLKGVQHVEIWLESVKVKPVDLKYLKKQLKDYKIIVHAPFINLSLISDHNSVNETTIKILEKTIDNARLLGAKLITIHAGAHPLFMERKKAERILVKNYLQLFKYAAKNDIKLAIENVSKSKTTQISYPVLLTELSSLKKRAPQIKFTLDTGHCVQNNDKLFLSFIKNNLNHIYNVHIHNAKKNNKAHFGLNKQGDFNWIGFLNKLIKIGYTNFLTVEILKKDEIEKSWHLLYNKFK